MDECSGGSRIAPATSDQTRPLDPRGASQMDLFIGHKFKVVVALVLSVAGCVLLSTLSGGAVAATTTGPDSCGYSDASFNENTVMRGAEIIGSGLNSELAAFANDENALLLGVNGATNTSQATSNGTNSFVAVNASGGDPSAVDASGRPLYP